MPVELAFYGRRNQSNAVRVLDQRRRQSFDVSLSFKPEWVDFDPDDVIEKRLEFAEPEAAFIAKAERDPAMMSRLSAVDQLGGTKGAGTQSAVTALGRVLTRDPFFQVRIHAAASLGRIHTFEAEKILLRALTERDSRVRVGVVQAVAGFAENPTVYAALVRAFESDPSEAVQIAAAEGIGASGMNGAVTVLARAVKRETHRHVMEGILRGLAATGDPRAVALLLRYAQPGAPERLRLQALQALAGIRIVSRGDTLALVDVARAALHDPFMQTQFAGEALAGAQHLSQLHRAIRAQFESAPTAFQKAVALAALRALKP
jgi:HEAT repeat protein